MTPHLVFTRNLSAAIVVLMCVSAHPLLARQAAPAQAATGAISGTLTGVDGRDRIRKALVKLVSTSPRLTRTTTTDGEGRFVFSSLPAAAYALSASRPGFLEVVYGARHPGPSRPGASIQLAAGQKIDNVSMALPRAGVIIGRVTDEFGDQAFNVPVRALRLSFSNGERVVQPAGNAVTDDQGAFRIAGLLPGEYLVTAVPRDTVAAAGAQAEALAGRVTQIQAAARGGSADAQAAVDRMEEARREGRAPEPPGAKGYVPIYYPGTPMASGAAIVRVGLSQEVFGIDVRLEIVETATVTGKLRNTLGGPIAGNVQLIDPAMPVSAVGVWFGRSRSDGSFSFAGVVPGDYVLRGHNSPPGEIGSPPGGPPFQMSAFTPVHVDASGPRDVVVTMQPNVSVSGALALDSINTPASPSRMRVSLLPISTSADWERSAFRATPAADGRFVLREVPAGRYRVEVTGLPAGWTLASAMFGSRDAADYHLTIDTDREYAGGVLKFTDRTSEIAGRLAGNALNAPVSGHTVILFPSDRQLWVPQSRRIHIAQSEADGRYAIRGLPAGEYRLAVISDVEPSQEFDRDFLGQLVAGSIVVLLGEGEQRTQDLRIR